ncbi:prepilin-type N-terminal cleavage/methylation domain-containing protein [Gilvimarinus sp. SDUM040013]|uniref:Prepilin-type N-terminal cleavage/methylation domain-containing protein n=1 Tax=Gilvimarinus gilvus TaxID=3058038 RepID=A0ABU4RYF5_9GAMM|nr:prepilin-type N-terminal cleavage/methylation domain-containing protein [Gilvimarinus sp. SDUM040013]MDO3385244.1 prepilin-type N-terminal cleavage/methylation domain-containing protein [Gilvimarinus sp. SDUM040013]MDX6849227.1 prepilin-type N-terminal cleavage/methylation domain-containing protein [Gilvimarinus sp. SDUM040013]
MNSHKGFTLIEMVVALTILSLVVMATLTGMRTLALTQTKLEHRADNNAELRAVNGFIRRLLMQAKPVPMFMFGRSEGHYFYGEANELIFASPMPIPGQQGGLFAMRISRDQDKLWLQLREGINFVIWGEEEAYLLADKVEDFTVSYRKDRYSPWQEQWNRNAEQYPPGFVKIALKVSGRYWPELIIPVRGW